MGYSMHMHNGWIDAARHCPSPNFNQRPAYSQIDLLVIHCISLPPREYGGQAIEAFFCNRLNPDDHPYFSGIFELKVAAHFLIRRDGEVVQFVSCDERAWHAGESYFCGRDNCNDFSIGVELEGHDDDLYTGEQYAALARLTHCLQQTYPGITSERIVGHEDIAPGRKTDPGPGFDWEAFRRLLCDGKVQHGE